MRIYIDFKSAPAYLAMQPTLALLERLGVTAEWLPYDARQAAIPPASDQETRGETHVRVRAEQRRETNLRYAAVQQLPMFYRDDPGSTRCALSALLVLEEDPLSFIRAAFAAYWQEGRDLDDAEVVGDLLACSYPGAVAFDPELSLPLLDSHHLAAEEFGLFDTPLYVIGDEMFLGREQLPWIESLLSQEP